jgi:hypothetical protein
MNDLDKLEKIYVPKKFLEHLISIGYSRVIFKITKMFLQLTNKKNSS